MDLQQVPQVNALMGEYQRIGSALTNLEQGGKITGINVAMGKAPPNMPAGAPMPYVTVPITGEPSPEVMEAIKKMLTERRSAVAKQLTDMGVEGLG